MDFERFSSSTSSSDSSPLPPQPATAELTGFCHPRQYFEAQDNTPRYHGEPSVSPIDTLLH